MDIMCNSVGEASNVYLGFITLDKEKGSPWGGTREGYAWTREGKVFMQRAIKG